MNHRWIFPLVLMALLAGCASQPDPVIHHPELGVVRIDAPSNEPAHVSQGRGFVVAADGMIVTCRHVVDRHGELLISTSDGRRFHADILQEDPESDLAILRVRGESFAFLRIFDGDIEPGMHVRVVGNNGIVHGRFDHWENFGKEIAFTARVDAGDAGGPLLADDGRVLGIVRGPSATGGPDNIAVPVWHVLQMMPEIRKSRGAGANQK